MSFLNQAKLKIILQDKLIDLSKSYYVSGTVDTNNNFIASKSKIFLNQSALIYHNQFVISTNGIYQLHLVDKVGNTQDTYLELGHSNWKLQGTFDDVAFKNLASELHVTVSVTGKLEEQKDMAWLNSYKYHVDNIFAIETKIYDAGFNITVKDFPDSYKTFLDSTIVTNQGLPENINISKLDNAIKEVVQNKINSGLNSVNSLTKKYNISTTNVIDNNSLNAYINYQNLGQAILKADSSQTWEAQYQADLKIQESNLNLHGYTIAQILGNKQEPQTKSQMENYDNSGESFHSWLQTETNSKYHKYQLDTGLEIGLPLFVLVSLISLTWYYRHTKKYKLFVFKRTNVKNKEKVDD